jgi:hypothetical protein
MKIILKLILAVFLLASGVFVYMGLQLEPGVAVGSTVPDVKFTGLDDAPIAVADLRGKVVLLDFWGST